MLERIFVVKYIALKKGFCYLSPNIFKELQGNSIKLNYGNNKVAYFSVDSPNPTVDDTHIGINSLYAKALGIEDKESVTLTNIAKLPTISSLTISPTNQDDYHVLEMVADNVQSTLLNQIRVLNNDQKIVIWIGAGLYLTVDVYDVQPISPGFIDNLTEVTIKPPLDQQNATDENSNVTKIGSFFNFFNRNQSQKIIDNDKKDVFRKFNNFKPTLILRTVPNTGILRKIGRLNHPFNLFTTKINEINSLEYPQIYLGKFLINSDQQNSEEKQLYFRVYYLEDFLHKTTIPDCGDHVFINDEILQYFNCDIGTRILLEPYRKDLPIIDEIEIALNRKSGGDIQHDFRQYLVDNCEINPFVLNKNFPLTLNNDVKFSINFQPVNHQFCLITDDFIRNYKLLVNDTILTIDNDKNRSSKLVKFDNYTLEMCNYKSIVEDSLFVFLENSKLLKKFDNILITGGPGTGKTTLLKIVENHLKSSPNYIFTKIVNCKTIKGKTIESLHKFFTKILYDSIHNQPSILILDDLNVLCDNVSDGDSQAQNLLYFNRISEMLEGLLEYFCLNNSIGVLATSPSTLKLNRIIYGSRGHHLFKNTYEIENLSKKDREIILKYFFKHSDVSVDDLVEISERTESFVVEDLANFTRKTLFESLQDNGDKQPLKVTLEHMERGLESTIVTSLDGIKLNPPGTKDFTDIGGVDDVKSLLTETLLWPSKYPDLFSGSPLRLPSGLLLYGPPGTGKTILAGAAATHCRLRLISVKGPELLSKYIGASEQAVRNVFEKAQSAKPCLLFFDEFDSLAPRRGHDNTGVTDRVVNQLLTQLDGVESCSTGVFVMAATSRPDLLDPALLRPGRLDRHLFIDLPDEGNRLKILQVLSKTLEFHDDIDLCVIAQKTDGFSGADLQSLLYTAQLMSVEDVFKDGTNADVAECHQITQQQLEEALAKTRPSLSPMERLNYQRRYKKFEGGGEDFQAGTRATLA